MDNFVYGIITVVFCTAVFCLSWVFQKQNNYRYALWLLLIGGLVLRIYVASDFYLHTWDERYHALVAKNLIQDPLKPTLYKNPVIPYDYQDWTNNHVWLHKQPLPLWTMALSMWVFGINEIALRIPTLLFSTIGIWLTYYIATFFFNQKTGYLAAFLFAINGLIIELTGGRVATDHIDIFFLFFIELSVFFTIIFSQNRKTIYNLLAGISMGAAILSKWLPALIVIPIWLLVVIHAKNLKPVKVMLQFLLLLIVSICVFLPWQLYIFKYFSMEASWESMYNFKHVTEAVEEHSGEFYYYLERLRLYFGELVYLVLLWFTWKTMNNIQDKKRLAIFIWFLIPLIFFSIAETKMKAYLLFTFPALFLMTAEFWQVVADYRNSFKQRWLLNLIMILLIALPVRYCIERMKPFAHSDRNPVWAQELRSLNQRNIEKGILLNYDRPIEAMFYTDLTVYRGIPDKAIIADLIAKGYSIIVNDNDRIPEAIRLMKGVTTEKLTLKSE